MTRALLIGAGTIGSRHLQGLAKAPELTDVLVIEPNADARRRAEALWHEVPEGRTRQLRFLDLSSLDQAGTPDFALVATTAPGRLQILERLLQFGIRRLLIEKIPFQSIDDYRRAVDLAAAARAKVHVNLPMRMIPLFQALRQRLAGRRFTMQVDNGDRGLGCNGLHFFDLFTYLADAAATGLEIAIDKPVRPSPRGGNLIDFSGRAAIRTATGARGTVHFVPGTNTLPVISITADGIELVADFNGDRVRANRLELSTAAFFMPMASQIAHRQMDEILNGTSVLPTLAEGFDLNRRMLDAYNHELTGRTGDDLVCSIT